VAGGQKKKEKQIEPPSFGKWRSVSEEKTDDNDTQQQPEKWRMKKTPVSEKMPVGNAQRKRDHIGIRED
jgi:hypothetical protein